MYIVTNKKINKGGVILWDFISNKKVLHRSYDNKMCFLYNCFLHVMTVGHDSRCIAASERYQTNVKVKANFKTTWLYAFHWSRSIIKSIKKSVFFSSPYKKCIGPIQYWVGLSFEPAAVNAVKRWKRMQEIKSEKMREKWSGDTAHGQTQGSTAIFAFGNLALWNIKWNHTAR